MIKHFCNTHDIGCWSDWFIAHKKDDIEPLENITKSNLLEYQNISTVMQNEMRILKEKLRIKKSMQDLRKTQLLGFFNACFEELERCKRDYLIDLENNELMFEQEFETIQDNIDKIEEEVNRETYDPDLVDEFCTYGMFLKTK